MNSIIAHKLLIKLLKKKNISVFYLQRSVFKNVLRWLHSKCEIVKMSQLCPPKMVCGMTILNKNAFSKKITVPCISLKTGEMQEMFKTFKKYLLKLKNFNPVQTLSNTDEKVIILDPNLVNSDTKYIDGCIIKYMEITVTYSNWSSDDILKAVIPEGYEITSSYSRVGHILHLNLKSHLLPQKKLIGEVLLEKIPGISLIVNKTDTVEESDNVYRSFKMEVLAGDGSTLTTVKENGCTFSFDFAKVFWNPRLSTEHERIVKKIKSGDILYDVMAGVGPFSIPVAKKKCNVLANDLNPESYKYLTENCKKNKVNERVLCYNMDGHSFILDILKPHMLNKLTDCTFIHSIHITMNLPASAIEFVPLFHNIFHNESSVPYYFNVSEKNEGIYLHVYTFCDTDTTSDAVNAVKKVLSSSDSNYEDLSSYGLSVHEAILVRCVAPNKYMMRVSLNLTWKFLALKSAISVITSKKLKVN